MTVTPVRACSTTLPPVSAVLTDGDTWISKLQADQGFGASPNLSLLTTAEGDRILVHFDVPVGIPVTSATLYFHISTMDAGLQIFVYALTGNVPFSENQTTWNRVNLTTLWSTPGGVYDVSKYVIFEPASSGCWVSLDGTDFVRE